mmetsp:Transcript_9555/g.31983  ORF Transcript_9555/g.31983 Transcript_9555/m.31983 type:complete len:129 (+) Transcript_9555:1335-1721(+)
MASVGLAESVVVLNNLGCAAIVVQLVHGSIVSLESDDGEAGDGSSSNNEVKLSRLVHLKGAWCQSARLPRRGFESRGFNSNHLRYEKIIICLLLFSTKQGNELFKPILCLVAPFHSRLQSPDILKVCT